MIMMYKAHVDGSASGLPRSYTVPQIRAKGLRMDVRPQHSQLGRSLSKKSLRENTRLADVKCKPPEGRCRAAPQIRQGKISGRPDRRRKRKARGRLVTIAWATWSTVRHFLVVSRWQALRMDVSYSATPSIASRSFVLSARRAGSEQGAAQCPMVVVVRQHSTKTLFPYPSIVLS